MAVAGDQSVTGTSTLQGDTSVGGDLSIDGAQSVGDLGASVRLNGNQTVPDRTTTKVAFELVDADDRNEFSTSTHAFTTANPGDYQVNCTLNWAQWFSAGDYYAMYIYVDGSSVGHVTRNSPGDTVPGSIVLNRLLRDLPAGTEIDVRIYHTYGDTRSVGGGRATVLDIIQLG